mmetsp:Transcript_33709/g.95365  ORF Transcript_33709/g.95365 Transcript_33709/m.95365 type:complete len:216 (+) Transcript_33709:1219-1866(+)
MTFGSIALSILSSPVGPLKSRLNISSTPVLSFPSVASWKYAPLCQYFCMKFHFFTCFSGFTFGLARFQAARSSSVMFLSRSFSAASFSAASLASRSRLMRLSSLCFHASNSASSSSSSSVSISRLALDGCLFSASTSWRMVSMTRSRVSIFRSSARAAAASAAAMASASSRSFSFMVSRSDLLTNTGFSICRPASSSSESVSYSDSSSDSSPSSS